MAHSQLPVVMGASSHVINPKRHSTHQLTGLGIHYHFFVAVPQFSLLGLFFFFSPQMNIHSFTESLFHARNHARLEMVAKRTHARGKDVYKQVSKAHHGHVQCAVSAEGQRFVPLESWEKAMLPTPSLSDSL